MTEYVFAKEFFAPTWPELSKLAKEHYAEMCERLKGEGIELSPFNPRIEMYARASAEGWLQLYTVRLDGQLVGHATIYITQDMHNGDKIASEDTIFITKQHRNGVGKRLVKWILEDLRQRGVKRAKVSPVTDLRVGKIWERMGFKPVAQLMMYIF